jgi:ubiquinone/menaquinone biosynthesis C-methylase UbiE
VSASVSVVRPLAPELTAALVNDHDLGFSRFLREVYFDEQRTGSVTAHAHSAFFGQARAFGLLDDIGGAPRLTPLGYEVANVAKEYVHWIDGGRQLPGGVTPELLNGARVLDVGCSFGRHLLNFTLHGAAACGVDFQHNYLRLSRPFAARHGVTTLTLARAKAEHLPFRSGAFDVVFCRLVINYVSNIDATIGEFTRVLRPGGTLVLIVDPIEIPLRAVLTHKWRGNAKTMAFTLFGLVNTAVLQLTGRQIVITRAGRMHSQQSPAWPTLGWFARRLARHGFVPGNGSALALREHRGTFVGRLKRQREGA